MTTTSLRFAALIVLISCGGASAQTVDALVKAKTLYAEASYDDALRVLGGSQAAEAHQYRALCFLALGKTKEAEAALEALVTVSPEYVISDSDSPPRLVSMHDQTRRRMLPAAIRSLFAQARDDFQAKDFTRARGTFERVLALTHDPAAAGATELKDLQLLTASYLEIVKNTPAPATPSPTVFPSASAPASTATRAPATPPAPGTPPAQVGAPSAAKPAAATSPTPSLAATASANPIAGAPAPETAAKGSPTLVPPVTIRQTMPSYTPGSGTPNKALTGSIRVVIGADGKVKTARIEQSVEPRYDSRLLAAAKSWTYKPATLNGAPIESEKLVSITVGAP